MATPSSWLGYRLNWIDESRDGYPRRDPFTSRHVFNPYYFNEHGGVCVCRLCEPLLWKYQPLPPLFDFDLPESPQSARNGRGWADLDAEYLAAVTEFTPL